MKIINPLSIIHENETFLALDKPSGLLVVRDRWDKDEPTLMGRVQEYLGKVAWPVHRLDRDASGIILFAKTAKARTHLEKQFQGRHVEKFYDVFTEGDIPEDKGSIHLSLSESPKQPGRMVIKGKAAKDALTEYEVLERFKGVTYLKVHPLTGRQHQIRVHMKSLGCPVICDPWYGSGKAYYLSEMKRFYKRKEKEPEKPLMGRLALHARSLTFLDLEENSFTVEAPLPKDFVIFLKYLRKFWARLVWRSPVPISPLEPIDEVEDTDDEDSL